MPLPDIAIAALAAFSLSSLVIHLASVAVAMRRARPPQPLLQAPSGAPAVSIVRPVCGLDHRLAETLGSSFQLAYPDYEILFCAASAGDPAIPVVQRLISAHPGVKARLLVGDDRVSVNPKLNNCVKGWVAATSSWIVLADANVLMPPDYIQRMLAAWAPGTGLVCSPPVGTDMTGLWSEIEGAFLNGYQARWQYVADALDLGFAQGKSMLWHRDILESAGGISMLGQEVAEDAAATKLVRQRGLRVRLVQGPFPQPLGQRSLSTVWRRQQRWAQLRRASFPLLYLPELLAGPLLPFLAALVAASASGQSALVAGAGLAAVWYGSELALARVCGWPLSWRSPIAMICRDLLLPALYVQGWRDTGFEWRGNAMRADNALTTPAHRGAE